MKTWYHYMYKFGYIDINLIHVKISICLFKHFALLILHVDIIRNL